MENTKPKMSGSYLAVFVFSILMFLLALLSSALTKYKANGFQIWFWGYAIWLMHKRRNASLVSLYKFLLYFDLFALVCTIGIIVFANDDASTVLGFSPITSVALIAIITAISYALLNYFKKQNIKFNDLNPIENELINGSKRSNPSFRINMLIIPAACLALIFIYAFQKNLNLKDLFQNNSMGVYSFGECEGNSITFGRESRSKADLIKMIKILPEQNSFILNYLNEKGETFQKLYKMESKNNCVFGVGGKFFFLCRYEEDDNSINGVLIHSTNNFSFDGTAYINEAHSNWNYYQTRENVVNSYKTVCKVK